MRYSPAQLYRAAIKAINDYAAASFQGAPFAKLSDADLSVIDQATIDVPRTLRGPNRSEA